MKYGPKIMPIIKELWNNTISPYKNWHKQINWFSILLNQTNVRKLEKKTEKGRETYLGHLPGPSPAGGPAHPRCLLSSPSSDRRTRACARRSPARTRAASPPAGHLLLPRTPSMPWTKPRSCLARGGEDDRGGGGLGRLLAGPACCGWAAQGEAPGKPLLFISVF